MKKYDFTALIAKEDMEKAARAAGLKGAARWAVMAGVVEAVVCGAAIYYGGLTAVASLSLPVLAAGGVLALAVLVFSACFGFNKNKKQVMHAVAKNNTVVTAIEAQKTALTQCKTEAELNQAYNELIKSENALFKTLADKGVSNPADLIEKQIKPKVEELQTALKQQKEKQAQEALGKQQAQEALRKQQAQETLRKQQAQETLRKAQEAQHREIEAKLAKEAAEKLRLAEENKQQEVALTKKLLQVTGQLEQTTREALLAAQQQPVDANKSEDVVDASLPARVSFSKGTSSKKTPDEQPGQPSHQDAATRDAVMSHTIQ